MVMNHYRVLLWLQNVNSGVDVPETRELLQATFQALVSSFLMTITDAAARSGCLDVAREFSHCSHVSTDHRLAFSTPSPFPYCLSLSFLISFST